MGLCFGELSQIIEIIYIIISSMDETHESLYG